MYKMMTKSEWSVPSCLHLFDSDIHIIIPVSSAKVHKVYEINFSMQTI